MSRDMDKAGVWLSPCGKSSDICPSQASPNYQLSIFPQWNCQNSHKTKNPPNYKLSTPHTPVSWIFPLRTPLAVKFTFLSCTNIDCYKFIIFCSEIPAQACIFNNFSSPRITPKFPCTISLSGRAAGMQMSSVQMLLHRENCKHQFSQHFN